MTGLSLLYGPGFSLRKKRKALPPESETSLKTKIEQLLTEARVIIPGGQALLGFQFVATLTKAFDNLPDEMKWLHAAALAAVALSVLLLKPPLCSVLRFTARTIRNFLKSARGSLSRLHSRLLWKFLPTSPL